MMLYMVHEKSVGSLETNLKSFPFFGGPCSGVIPFFCGGGGRDCACNKVIPT